MISVVIASRVDQYLQQTIDDILSKAEGEVEVIVVLDGYWPEPMIRDDKRVIVLHHGEVHNNYGMRASINAGVDIARGEYIFQIDEHCMVDQGWDIKLLADMRDNWVVIPRRKRLDAENWSLVEDGRPDVDYMYIEYPYLKPYDKTQGLHGAEDRARGRERKDILIDDVMTCQGSCYFLKRSYWYELFPNGLDDKNYGPFTQEAQEITNTCWLSGGEVKVNKKTWYAHFHKGKRGKGYGFSTEQYKRHAELNEKGRLYCIDKWLYTTDYKHDFDWLLKKFWPVPGWTEEWKERVKVDREKDYSVLGYENDYWLSNLKEEKK